MFDLKLKSSWWRLAPRYRSCTLSLDLRVLPSVIPVNIMMWPYVLSVQSEQWPSRPSVLMAPWPCSPPIWQLKPVVRCIVCVQCAYMWLVAPQCALWCRGLLPGHTLSSQALWLSVEPAWVCFVQAAVTQPLTTAVGPSHIVFAKVSS